MDMQAIITQFEEQKKLAQQQLQDGFKGFCKEFFEKAPEVKAVVWAQYTPYFNDGDPCVFHVRGATITNAEGDALSEVDYYGEYDGEDKNIWATEIDWLGDLKEKFSEASLKTIDEFSKVVNSSAMEEVFEAMFGDGVKVIVTKDKIDVEEHEHD